jgi:signal transduction histidine kinase
MIKVVIIILLSATFCSVCTAQNKFTDSLIHQLSTAEEDTSRALIMADLCYFYRYTNIDSAIIYGQSALELSRTIKFSRGEADALNKLGLAYREEGDLPKSLDLEFQAFQIAENNGYTSEIRSCFRRIGHVYLDLNDYKTAASYSLQALKIDTQIQDKRGEAIESMDLGMIYQQMHQSDSALYYAQHSLKMVDLMEDLSPDLYRVLGNIWAMNGNKNDALNYYKKGIQVGFNINDFRTISFIYANMAMMFRQMNQPDSSFYYAKNALKYGQMTSYKKGILLAGNLLSELYDSVSPKEALRYYKIASAAKDSLFGAGNIQTIQVLIAHDNERKKEMAAAKEKYENKMKFYALLAGLTLLLIVALILYHNNRQKQKTNKVLESTLTNLRSTQSQLIQSEKMASLGELTAGIAHEIQNPLNFVNNFSEVNRELIEELKEEAKSGHSIEVIAIADNISANEEKIIHHGKRADSIVKGMLAHSRISYGVKEPTDINALADQYLRLAYHGLRAKDKSFNVEMRTDFDISIGKINIIPQDIGRVLLNLYNNAFYAVTEKAKQQPKDYEPTVSVSSKKMDNKVILTVKDNGNGIPQKVKDKIFQPFFTTKPTGEGTGLGLSLSYDIIKAHGGEIKVESIEGEGSQFLVELPS